jgi:hypothetical protein
MKKKILAFTIGVFSTLVGAATTNPVQLLNPAGSTSGQAVVSTGPSSAPSWGSVAAGSTSFTQTGTGAITRSLGARAQDYIDAADFGVKCDGVTNNTTAFNNAVAAAQAANRPLYIFSNGGTCMTDLINYGTPNNQISIYGDGATLQKITNDGNPVMQIGSLSMTHYIGPITISGLIFSGFSASTTPAALLSYDLVRSKFSSNTFQNAQVGHLAWGEISNYYQDNIFQNNQIGYRADANASLFGGGIPNLITMIGNRYVNNSTYGIFYNGGNELLVKGFDIEGNGTTGTPASGGAYIAALSSGVGASFDSGWFEANAGGQNLWLNSGQNDVRSTMFIASPNATNDIKISAGNYSLKNVVCVNSKSPNILESSSSTGNTIDDTFCPNVTFNAANTKVFSPTGGNSINGNTNFTGSIQPSSTGGIVGTTLADAANAGSVGQVVSSNVAVGSAISLTSGTAANITSISLPAGDWDVWGTVATNPAGTTTQSFTQASISTVSATIQTSPNGGGTAIYPYTVAGGNPVTVPAGTRQINVSTTTTVYLVINSTFATSTNTAYGFIGARRRR